MLKRILAAGLLALLLGGCTPSPAPDKEPGPEKVPPAVSATEPAPSPSPQITGQPAEKEGADMPEYSKTAPLMAEADTEEAARELAELYGISLVDYRYGLATFATDEDPREVIRRGQENGWPELTLNRVSRPF